MKSIILILFSLLVCAPVHALQKSIVPTDAKYELIYSDDLTNQPTDQTWIMEGPGVVTYGPQGMAMKSTFYDQWLTQWLAMSEKDRMKLGNAGINKMMYEIAKVLDPTHANEAMTHKGFKGGHQVFWLNQWLPENIAIEYDFVNESPAGLYINFFAANAYGKDIFSPDLSRRFGVFEQYTHGDFTNYHVSFAARFDGTVRGTAHLRINPGSSPVAECKDLIAKDPYKHHKIRINKWAKNVEFVVDDQVCLTYTKATSQTGFFGLRQMSTSFAYYKNLRIYIIKE